MNREIIIWEPNKYKLQESLHNIILKFINNLKVQIENIIFKTCWIAASCRSKSIKTKMSKSAGELGGQMVPNRRRKATIWSWRGR